MKATLFAVGLVAATSLAALGCDDPAKDKAKAVTAAAPAAPAAVDPAKGSVKQTFDQSTSKVAWVGSKVTGKHDGGFSTFKGSVDVVDGDPEKSKVDVEIDAASITSDAEKLTGHLKSADFFDVEKHPKATFASTSIKKGGDKGASHTVTGNLTIKGITKAVTFPATIQASADQSSVDADFAINRRDFSLNYAGMPNDLIRDDVVIKLTIRAKKPTS
ncbi:MAG: YceI family protein [Labilithrix sp.]|nr:YceI family protein [Labilithrix sp.]